MEKLFRKIELDILDMKKNLDTFLTEIQNIDWFCKCGIETDDFYLVHSIFEAYDGWNKKMLATWEPHIIKLEKNAINELGDEIIDDVFEEVAVSIGDSIWEKWSKFVLDKHPNEVGIENEVLNFVKMNISWACIEKMINKEGFFQVLLSIYMKGYSPFSWEGDYPNGLAVIM